MIDMIFMFTPPRSPLLGPYTNVLYCSFPLSAFPFPIQYYTPPMLKKITPIC